MVIYLEQTAWAEKWQENVPRNTQWEADYIMFLMFLNT